MSYINIYRLEWTRFRFKKFGGRVGHAVIVNVNEVTRTSYSAITRRGTMGKLGIRRDIQGWTGGTEGRIAHLYRPHTDWPKLSEYFLKLPPAFDIPIDELRRCMKNVRKNFGLRPIIVDSKTGKKRRTYRGIGLTTRPHSNDPIYEASQYFNPEGDFVSSAKSLGLSGIEIPGSRSSLFEREFDVVNSVAPQLAESLKARFGRWVVTKIRIMELLPEGVIAPHVDHPYYEQIRLHAVIESNPNVFWEVEGHQFQIPCDGSLYWFDTGRVHSVYNFGDAPRAVLSLHLCPAIDINNKPIVGDLIRDLTIGNL